jgi:hypothetical protein
MAVRSNRSMHHALHPLIEVAKIKIGLGNTPGMLSHSSSLRRIGEQFIQGKDGTLQIVLSNQKTGSSILHNIRNASVTRRENGRTASHGFLNHAGHALRLPIMASHCMQGKDIGGGKQLTQVSMGLPTVKHNPISGPRAGCQLVTGTLEGPLPDQMQSGVGMLGDEL